MLLSQIHAIIRGEGSWKLLGVDFH